ncbi:hypothetical protein [Pectobacterium wasabiae]|uniref:phage tail fiber protein n=1 Tax=Pectobacterium wasabiae TaxID=55208 RepID=UPI00027B0AE1|nr:hypothetical protein [Pectobacterium wasabiae]AOR64874.1 hypothetical protein A7983_16755 [Pectobacterium wasabiae CFBP 3304]EJS96298.1 Hypothetical protein Y17_0174 [Pectobacterium wasabiae CFBP 3304]
MSWYKTGFVTVTNNSKIITGTGTQFTNPLNGVSAGRMLLLPGAGTVQIYEIESVQSDTQLTLVSAFEGTTGSGKPYAIPTSPSVSIEQFAHEFASTLAYYQQQLQGWQSILTGSGDITLTAPDGQTITVRSQAEWDRLLSQATTDISDAMKKSANGSDISNVAAFRQNIGLQNAMLIGQFGWGGKVPRIPDNVDLLEYFTSSRPTGLYWGGPALNKPAGFTDVLYEWLTIEVETGLFYGTLTAYNFTPGAGGYKIAGLEVFNNQWGVWGYVWDTKNLPSPVTESTAQWITGDKGFKRDNHAFTISSATPEAASYIIAQNSNGVNLWYLGKGSSGPIGNISLYNYKGLCGVDLNSNGSVNINAAAFHHNGHDVLSNGLNAVADSGGYWKTASPVINIYADGSFTTTDEAAGVKVERLSEGVYKITGCQGMHPDAAWNGIDGGVSNPKCRNDKALLWNNYEVDDDGSVTVHTFHRVHPDAMPFAQNRLTLDKEPFDPKKGHTSDMEWPDQTPIDVPRGLFIQVRVNMPERIETKPVVSHSNVYCNTISPV